MTKEKLTCVPKRDWRYYKTCNECGIKNKCTRGDKPGWFGRIVETIVVGWYRRKINKGLRGMFGHLDKKTVRRLRDETKKFNSDATKQMNKQ